MLLSSAAVIWLLLRLVPANVALWLGLAIVVIALALVIWGRHFMIGRYRAQRREWARAIESYQRFEKMMLTTRHGGLLLPLFLGIYTLDGIALTRNNIAQALMNLDQLDAAEGWLRSALLRDPLYPTPYINLGTIAVLRGQEAHGRRQFQKAVGLGYSVRAAQLQLARALARASESARKALD